MPLKVKRKAGCDVNLSTLKVEIVCYGAGFSDPGNFGEFKHSLTQIDCLFQFCLITNTSKANEMQTKSFHTVKKRKRTEVWKRKN